MKKHIKKMIAPIIITIFFVLYYVGLIVFIAHLTMSLMAKIGLLFVLASLGGLMIGVCIQRLKEIRSGEEDDLSQY